MSLKTILHKFHVARLLHGRILPLCPGYVDQYPWQDSSKFCKKGYSWPVPVSQRTIREYKQMLSEDKIVEQVELLPDGIVIGAGWFGEQL